jgi:hypothetical protein
MAKVVDDEAEDGETEDGKISTPGSDVDSGGYPRGIELEQSVSGTRTASDASYESSFVTWGSDCSVYSDMDGLSTSSSASSSPQRKKKKSRVILSDEDEEEEKDKPESNLRVLPLKRRRLVCGDVCVKT